MIKDNKIDIVFFGTDEWVSISVLEELSANDYTPSCIVTVPDRPQGRKMIMTPSPVKVWATSKNIPVLQPEKLDSEFIESLKEKCSMDLFIVASYGKIIPQTVLDLPKYKTLNVHPSLLPLYRGATPIESAILDDQKETGVTIIRMDEEMDHGPIILQEFYHFKEWPSKEIVSKTLAQLGGSLLVESIDDWVKGEIDEQEQDHNTATYTKKIVKEDGWIKPTDKDRESFLKYIAYTPWPGAHFFITKNEKSIRVKITEATFEDGKFVIKKAIPEGKKEMDFSDFAKGYLQ